MNAVRQDAIRDAIHDARDNTLNRVTESLSSVFGPISDDQRSSIKEALSDYHIENFPD